FPPRQNVGLQPHAIFLASGLCELHHGILGVILEPEFGELAEQDRANFDRMLGRNRSLTTRFAAVKVGEELVTFKFRLLLAQPAVASTRADRVELAASPHGAVGK